MTGYNKIFIDTAPFIYYLEQNPKYFNAAKDFFVFCYENKKELTTSVITIEEYSVYPYIQNKYELIYNFEKFLSDLDIKIIDIDKSIALQAAKIRSNYKNFKGMDALQLASAAASNCSLFITNDKQLKQFKGIKCITFDDWNFYTTKIEK